MGSQNIPTYEGLGLQKLNCLQTLIFKIQGALQHHHHHLFYPHALHNLTETFGSNSENKDDIV